MFTKYKFPLNLFLIFEKINPVIFTSECLTLNHYLIYLPKEWYFSFAKVLKNELFYSSSYLVDNSAIDKKNYNKINSNLTLIDKGNRLFLFNTFYFYFIKIKLSLIVNINIGESLPSLESLYPNSNWVERETSEMFGVIFNKKKDIRNLLLDYSRNEYPLLKEFPCEGYYDVYYDFFEDQLQYVESEFVEL